MKENMHKRVGMPRFLRPAAIAAAMVCALAVTAVATEGALFRTLREVWSDGYETRYEAVDEDGNVMDVSVVAGSTVRKENGRMILCAVNEEIDITDKIAETGAYHQEWVMERRTVTVDVTGTQEDWTLVEEVAEEDGSIYRSTFTSRDLVDDVNIGTAVINEDTDETGVADVVTVTTTENTDVSVRDAAE